MRPCGARRRPADGAALAEGVRSVPGAEVLNDVVYTQVCFAFEDDARTAEVGARLIADGSTSLAELTRVTREQ